MKDDSISRKAAVRHSPIIEMQPAYMQIDKADVLKNIVMLPPAPPEYEPVNTGDFAKTMSENTIYSFMAWYGEALELMERHGFVICKKTL